MRRRRPAGDAVDLARWRAVRSPNPPFNIRSAAIRKWLRGKHEYPTASTGIPVCQSEPIEIEIRPRSVKCQSERPKALYPISRIGSRRSPERQHDRRGKLLPACRTLFPSNGRERRLNHRLHAWTVRILRKTAPSSVKISLNLKAAGTTQYRGPRVLRMQ